MPDGAGSCQCDIVIADSLIGQERQLSMYWLNGLNKCAAKKMRDDFKMKSGDVVVVNQASLQNIATPICRYKKYVLKRVEAVGVDLLSSAMILKFTYKKE
jgi:hypothetical protein